MQSLRLYTVSISIGWYWTLGVSIGQALQPGNFPLFHGIGAEPQILSPLLELVPRRCARGLQIRGPQS